MNPKAAQPRSEWLINGGELGELIRSVDWTTTPLGPRDRWPQSLRTVVNLVVASRMPMALLWCPDLLFLYNDAYREIAADKHPRALGRSTRVIWPEVWHINEPIFTAVMKRGETLYLEDKLFPINRRGRWEEAYFTLCYSPVRIEDGVIGGTLVTLQETTNTVLERKRLATELRRIVDVFEHGDACIVLDRDFRVVLVNEQQERLSRKPRQESLGRVFWEVWPETARSGSKYWDEYHRAMRDRVPVQFEDYYEPLDLWTDVHVYATQEGGIAIFFRDATERKRAEEQLRDAYRHKDEFLAMLSHELRNPLGPIRNGLYILDRVPPGSAQSGHALQIIGRQVNHMARLVDDLLDVTRISRGKVQLQRERVDLRDVVRHACEDMRPTFEAAGVNLMLRTCEAPLPIDGDATRLAQIVGNLLANAAKFTPRGGHVVVSADCGAPHAVVRVQDDGAGIEPELLRHLFEPFRQADRTLDRSKGGLGLGLALVRGLVELHRGAIEARSAGANQGAEFIVRLPLAAVEEAGAPPPATGHDAEHCRVLVIEDNVDAAESLRIVLEHIGHDVAVAYDGIEGLLKARNLRPEIVLCDIGLPGMDGYSIARAIRSDEALRSTRLVAVTGYASHDDVQRAIAAGFNYHVPKPPNLDRLTSLVEELC